MEASTIFLFCMLPCHGVSSEKVKITKSIDDRSTYLCLPSAGIKSMCRHHLASFALFLNVYSMAYDCTTLTTIQSSHISPLKLFIKLSITLGRQECDWLDIEWSLGSSLLGRTRAWETAGLIATTTDMMHGN